MKTGGQTTRCHPPVDHQGLDRRTTGTQRRQRGIASTTDRPSHTSASEAAERSVVAIPAQPGRRGIRTERALPAALTRLCTCVAPRERRISSTVAIVDKLTTRYARNGESHVAFQVLGDGPLDLLLLPYGNMVSIDARGDEPHWSRFEQRLASFSRLIRFDPGGLGLSDPLDPSVPMTLEGWAQDAEAVLDAAGSARAALFGSGTGGMIALLLSATRPARVMSQVLFNTTARICEADDYPFGVPQAFVDELMSSLFDAAPTADSMDDLDLLAPSLSDDVNFRSWWQQAGQRGASPRSARAIHLMQFSGDVRAALPAIGVPTLVIHRTETRLLGVEHGRYLADQIPGAALREIPGADFFPFTGDSDRVVAEAQEFLTGLRPQPAPERVLATLLFTDIVGSTSLAASQGDARWRELLDSHDQMASRLLTRFGGRLVTHTGDGMLATFTGPGRAISCALAIEAGGVQLGIGVRAGIHAGEVELRGDQVSGIGVHIAQRVSSLAVEGEVLVSSTVRDLVAGSSTTFVDRGAHQLKGVPGRWAIFAVAD